MKASPLFRSAVQDPYGAHHSTLHGASTCSVHNGATMHEVQCQEQLKQEIPSKGNGCFTGQVWHKIFSRRHKQDSELNKLYRVQRLQVKE
jgi:hypothetical protein